MFFFIEGLVLLAGFALLVKGADFLVEGAIGLSRRFGVPELVIGLTICAFGTSAPELFVNGVASVRHQDGLVLGNVLGSNLFNTLVVLGVGALIGRMAVERSALRKELVFGVLAAGAFAVLANDSWFGGSASEISRWDAALLLLLFAIFLRRALTLEGDETEGGEDESLGRAGMYLLLGAVGLPLGAHFVVLSATKIADALGVSEGLVGLTLVSVGTSLPELAATAVAARKGHGALAVGNVLGSNVFNLLLVLGVSSALSPIAFDAAFNAEIALFVVAGGLVAVLALRQEEPHLTRGAGILLLVVFAAYLVFIGAREVRSGDAAALEPPAHEVELAARGAQGR